MNTRYFIIVTITILLDIDQSLIKDMLTWVLLNGQSLCNMSETELVKYCDRFVKKTVDFVILFGTVVVSPCVTP